MLSRKVVPEKEATSKHTKKKKKLMTSKTDLFAESPRGFRSFTIFIHPLIDFSVYVSIANRG